jgi:hypothetical protein
VTLAWDPSPEPDVAKYVLYQGQASGQYTRQIEVTNRVNGVLVTTNTVTGLAASTTYYFVVTARSVSGLESPPSNEIAYTTPAGANVPPVISCPANLSGIQATGPGGAVVNYPAPTVSDPDSPAPTVTSVPASGSVFPLGTTTVTCTARDSSGNTASCSFTVTVVDTIAPAIAAPANIAGVQATGPTGAVVSYTGPTATDLVDGSRPVTCSPASGSVFPIGTTTVTCTAKDTRNNTATSTFTVTVVDTQAPTISTPANIAGVEATGPSGVVVNYPAPSATDLVDGSRSVTSSPASGSVFPLGTTTVTCTAKDACGNSCSTSFTVTVVDTQAPTITTPANIAGVEATGPSGAVVNYPAPSATDLVDGSRSVTSSPPSGSVFPIGTTTVTCTSSDTRGNTATGSFTVKVLEKPATMTAKVVGRYLFYNNSYWDGKNPAANPSDDLAIAPDKVALLPGSKASFANYSSYSRGINGVMVDIEGVQATLSGSEFEFRVGNDNSPAGWAVAPAPTSVATRVGAGNGGSTRVTVIWADNAIQKRWLQIRVRSTANTGLAADDVFYFGNAVGEVGNNATDAVVDAADLLISLSNMKSKIGAAPMSDRYDNNRDSFVDNADALLCRQNYTTASSALQLITPVLARADGPSLMAAAAAVNSAQEGGVALASLPEKTVVGVRSPATSTGLPGAQPRLHLSIEESGAVSIACLAQTGARLELQTADDLMPGSWKTLPVAGVLSADGRWMTWRLNEVGQFEARFFRVAVHQ